VEEAKREVAKPEKAERLPLEQCKGAGRPGVGVREQSAGRDVTMSRTWGLLLPAQFEIRALVSRCKATWISQAWAGLAAGLLWFLPAAALGLWVGNRMHMRVASTGLVRTLYGLLIVSGLSLIVRALLALPAQ
jgi:hypothetical protein